MIRHLALLATVSLPCSAASAQTAPPSKLPGARPTRERPVLDRVLFDEPGDGAIWARGSSYKARFGAEGATVVPFLGSRAAASHPVAFEIESLTVGGAPVAFDADVPPARAGERVNFDRGGVVERYDLALASLEQSFVIASLPASGDLVLRLAVATDLAPVERAEGLRFECDLGGLAYGRATLVDGAGRKTPLATGLDGPSIEIRVPAAVLADAALPLTIDPVISTFAIDTTTLDDYSPDVAYDATTDRYIVCYEETYNATDHDIYEELLDASGVVVAGGYVDFTTAYWGLPRVANNASADQFMVVAHVGASPTRSIMSRTVAAATNVMGSQVTVAPAYFNHERLNPDIGGDPAPSGTTRYLVVFEELNTSTGERWIVQQLMDTSGNPNSSGAICIECTNGTRNFNPAVSNSAGQGPGLDHRWTVVWEREVSTSDHDIWGAQQTNALLVLGPYPISTGSDDDRRPTVSSFADSSASPGDYLVAWDRFVFSDYDIYGRILDGTTTVAISNISLNETIGFAFQDQISPAADSDGCAFALAYQELYSTSTVDWDVYVATLTRVGFMFGVHEAHRNLAFTGFPDLDVEIAAARGGPAGRYLSAWTLQNTPNSDVYGGLYETPPVVLYCYPGIDGVATCPCANPPAGGGGCDNSVATGGATLSVAGTPSLSADTLAFSQTGELATSLSIFLQGDADVLGGTTFGGGVRCVGGTLKRLYVHNAVGGTVSAPVGGDPSVSARSAALGDTIPACATRFCQVYYRDPNLVFCAAGFNVGNGAKVLWAP